MLGVINLLITCGRSIFLTKSVNYINRMYSRNPLTSTSYVDIRYVQLSFHIGHPVFSLTVLNCYLRHLIILLYSCRIIAVSFLVRVILYLRVVTLLYSVCPCTCFYFGFSFVSNVVGSFLHFHFSFTT